MKVNLNSIIILKYSLLTFIILFSTVYTLEKSSKLSFKSEINSKIKNNFLFKTNKNNNNLYSKNNIQYLNTYKTTNSTSPSPSTNSTGLYINQVKENFKSKYIPPPISHSLFEKDPTSKIMRKEFLKTFKFTLYNLNKGEANSIFDFADVDKDDLLDHIEWNAFLNLFVYSFEECDINRDFILDLDEWTKCWDYSP